MKEKKIRSQEPATEREKRRMKHEKQNQTGMNGILRKPGNKE